MPTVPPGEAKPYLPASSFTSFHIAPPPTYATFAPSSTCTVLR